MPTTLRCPACGNAGEATLDTAGGFEVRGQYQGKAVRKCNKCGAGIFLGWFGKTRLIPADLWQRMQEVWEREFGGDESLGDRFWGLQPQVKARLVTPAFLNRCVAKLAADMTAAVLQHVPGVEQAFPQPSDRKHLQGELGAMVIDGYIATLVTFGALPQQHPLLGYLPEEQQRLADQIEERWGNLQATDISDQLHALLTEIVVDRLQMEGFNKFEDNAAMGTYLYLLTLNGAAWARAEQEILAQS